ncbi:putative late blight resistance protein R1A-10 [Salvia divinorum]|uniref:Late blight resistance protein R1A-10 n=1 Tax=Salvia divinorum TaxID=28513 RepID=A0ABD1GVI9_SALDI
MSYNLQSLITILQQILNPQQSLWIVDLNKPQLHSLLEKAESLLRILEKSSFTNMASLESRIRDLSYEAEDIIESHMVHQMLSNPKKVKFTFFTPHLEQVMQQLHSATEQLLFMAEKTSTSSSSAASLSHHLTSDVQQATRQLESVKLVEENKRLAGAPFLRSKNDLVGVDEDLLQLKDRLTNMQSKLEIIPITGMGGIVASAQQIQKEQQEEYDNYDLEVLITD